jgi:hypothetical protein
MKAGPELRFAFEVACAPAQHDARQGTFLSPARVNGIPARGSECNGAFLHLFLSGLDRKELGFRRTTNPAR